MPSAPSTSPSDEHLEAPKLAPDHQSSGPAPTATSNSETKSLPFIDKLPDWASNALRSPRAWKTLLRCWLAAWLSFIVLLPSKSLATMGNAALFSFLTTLLLSPNLPLALYMLFMATMMIGMLLAWGLSAAAMRSALAARDQVLLRSQYERFQASTAGYSNPDQLFTIQIFQGAFLDVRSSVVYGVFLAFGNFVFAAMRAYVPSLIFTSIFGTIVMDVFCTIGPLFPFANYFLINSVLISASTGIAIAVLASIFIFPQSASHLYLTATSDLLGKLTGLISLHDAMLKSDPDGLQPDSPLLARLNQARIGLLSYHTQLRAASGFLNVEVSFGRWNGEDVKALEERLFTIITRIGAFHSFAAAVGHSAKQQSPLQHTETISEQSTSLAAGSTHDTFLLRHFREHHSAAAHAHSVRIHDLLPLIERVTADLRHAFSDGLRVTQSTIEFVNKRRYKRDPMSMIDQHTRALDTAIENLQRAHTEFAREGRLAFVEPYAELIKSVKSEEQRHKLPMQALLLAYAYASNLLVSTDSVLDFMRLVRDTHATRPHARLWGPSHLRRAFTKLLASREADGALGEGPAVERIPEPSLNERDEDKRETRRDPDSLPPKNLLQRITHGTHVLHRWTGTAEAAFIFKYVVVSIALWLPAVSKSSAHFYYVEKGLWALIMAQTSLNVYASDQLFNYFTRILCTVVGLVLGLLAWYIGCQKGNGNPYGIAASTGVILVPVLFVRINCPQRLLGGMIMGAATFALIIGYSWIDGHLRVLSNPGIGWSVAWRRWVLVMIGIAASFILMLFPAKSGRKAVRVHNAALITSISRIYSSLMSIWIAGPIHTRTNTLSEKNAQGGNLAEELDKALRGEFLLAMKQVQSVREETVLARWEGSVRGAWPAAKYDRILEIESVMLTNLGQLSNALSYISPEWRKSSLARTGIVNPHFITDMMSIFSHVASSLNTGNPLPEVLPENLLDRFFYHHHHHNLTTGNGVNNGKPTGVDDVEGADLPQFSTNFLVDLRSLDYVHYATAVLAVLQLTQALDELHSTTKELCGEVPMRGFEQWRDDYERARAIV